MFYLFLLLRTISSWICLRHSRNLEPRFLNVVINYSTAILCVREMESILSGIMWLRLLKRLLLAIAWRLLIFDPLIMLHPL